MQGWMVAFDNLHKTEIALTNLRTIKSLHLVAYILSDRTLGNVSPAGALVPREDVDYSSQRPAGLLLPPV